MDDQNRTPDRTKAETPDLRLSSVAVTGLLIIAVCIAGFAGWATLAPLSSAAIAPGVVVAESSKKIVQHFEGGIVAEFLVKDGHTVKAGDPLLRLDVTKAKSTLNLLRARLADALAAVARLEAERDNQAKITFPAELTEQRATPRIAKIMSGQRNIFLARRRSMIEQLKIIQQRIAQSEEEISGYRAQANAAKIQLSLLQEEIKDLKMLVAKGLARKPRLLQLHGRHAEISGEKGRNVAAIARVGQRVAENRLMLNVLGTKRLNEAVTELKTEQAGIYDLREQIRNSEDILRRTEIIAPISGTIVDMQIHTTGGVIAPGERLMDIVPSMDLLVIHARIDPKDIDVVRAGSLAQIRLTAYNQRHISPIMGRVMQVSADRLDDPKTGLAYYLATVRLPGDLAKTQPDIQVTSGMQAEIVINTGERTLLEYFLKPVQRSFQRALRED